MPFHVGRLQLPVCHARDLDLGGRDRVGHLLSFVVPFHVGRLRLPVCHTRDLNLRGRGRVKAVC